MQGATIGIDIETNEPVTLSYSARSRGLHIIGATGTGKSQLLKQLILQDIDKGLGLCLLDPYGNLIDSILGEIPDRRLEDVIVLDPTDVEWPFGLNVFDPRSTSSSLQSRSADIFIAAVRSLYGTHAWGPRLEELMRMVAHTLSANPGSTMADIPLLLMNSVVRDRFVQNVRNDAVRLMWQQLEEMPRSEQLGYIQPALNRISIFLFDNTLQN
jgi:hypothetical protein